MKIKFAVSVAEEHLLNDEEVAVFGELPQLGAWNVQKGLRLKPTEDRSIWSAEVEVPGEVAVYYRYFIMLSDPNTKQLVVRRWESYVLPREYVPACGMICCHDKFGYIHESQRNVHRGWLSVGYMVEFKLFNKAVNLLNPQPAGETLRLKLEPVDPEQLTPILPSSRALTEYALLRFGDSQLKQQPDLGVPYQNDDILLFHTFQMQCSRVAYMLKLYAAEAKTQCARLLGYQYIYPDLVKGTRGEFTITLVCPVRLIEVASVHIEYLVVGFMPTEKEKPGITFVNYWRSGWVGLDVGHRGLGKYYIANPAPVPENTLASIMAAGELGADMVEFDVMLTKDLVPIIYHDWHVLVAKDHMQKPTSPADLRQVNIKDMTFEELNTYATYHVIEGKMVEYPAPKNVANEDERLFPRLEDFLRKPKKSLAFNIEVKWPQIQMDGKWQTVQTLDKDMFANIIIGEVQQHARGRFCFYSSFDPEMCLMLALKQSTYAVCYLLEGEWPYYTDPRTQTVLAALCTVQMYGLLGVVGHTSLFQVRPDIMQMLSQIDKKAVLLWGSAMKDEASIAKFRALGVSGLIYDRMDLFLQKREKSRLEQDEVLAQLQELMYH